VKVVVIFFPDVTLFDALSISARYFFKFPRDRKVQLSWFSETSWKFYEILKFSNLLSSRVAGVVEKKELPDYVFDSRWAPE
jgi:hypothetical protein